MFGRILERRRTERAARRYATLLPSQLVRDFGAAESYTPAQIRRAAERAKLPPEHLAIGYAAFLSDGAFADAVGPERAGEYEALRALFASMRRSTPSSASGSAEQGLGGGVQGPGPD